MIDDQGGVNEAGPSFPVEAGLSAFPQTEIRSRGRERSSRREIAIRKGVLAKGHDRCAAQRQNLFSAMLDDRAEVPLVIKSDGKLGRGDRSILNRLSTDECACASSIRGVGAITEIGCDSGIPSGCADLRQCPTELQGSRGRKPDQGRSLLDVIYHLTDW